MAPNRGSTNVCLDDKKFIYNSNVCFFPFHYRKKLNLTSLNNQNEKGNFYDFIILRLSTRIIIFVRFILILLFDVLFNISNFIRIVLDSKHKYLDNIRV